MVTRRKEPFRYSMEAPLDCRIEITAIDRMPVTGRLAQVELLDISKNGCKIRSQLDLHAADHSIECLVHMQLNDEPFVFPGRIRWQRELESPYQYYGVQLQMSAEEKEKVNVELRTLAAERKIKVM
ncbi:PilZ domain-containing protein [Paenibacillus caui]|uniref:PilZ domain-containing protein n=1 Tax=Paenibacillus caui TaxID=2873927 RepID=UPI001CA7E467|nr:PilZ domain-containing protein [Paenibacillus caui]